MLGMRLGVNKNEAKAQGMVEFALVLPVLLLVILGLFEVGRAVFIYSTVVTAAREAARYGSTTEWYTQYYVGNYIDCPGIRQKAQKVDFLDAFADTDIIIQYDHGPNNASTGPIPGYPAPFSTCADVASKDFISGDRIIVQVTGYFYPIVPIVPMTNLTFRSVSARSLLGNIQLP